MAASLEPAAISSFEDARHIVEAHAAGLCEPAIERVELLLSAGRVLAESVLADRAPPPFPRSTRDGYAVRAADLAQLPVALEVIGEIRAGEKPEEIPASVERGQAVSIMTGAPVPSGADAVIMVEYNSLQGARVEIAKGIGPGDNVVARGAEARQGSLLLDKGVLLKEAAIALAASVGKLRLEVYRRPQVAVITTGDEIVDLETVPGPTQIRNSNSHSLAVQIGKAGGDPVLLPIAADERQRLREIIEGGVQSGLL